MKIAVKHYVEITEDTQLEDLHIVAGESYLINEGGKQYLVEIWS